MEFLRFSTLPFGALTTTLPPSELMLSTHRSPSVVRTTSPAALAFTEGAETVRESAPITVPRGETRTAEEGVPMLPLSLERVMVRPTIQVLGADRRPCEAVIDTGP